MTPIDCSPPGPVVNDPGLNRKFLEGLSVLILALSLNLIGNGRISLWDRDEPRYAQCTREMRSSGDWIHPTFNAEPRYHKPVLIYWLMLAGTFLGGDNPFGARLISSLAGAATCLIVLAWGRRMLGPKAGFLAALILATAPIVVAESKLATTDATLMLWVVICQFALWELSQRASWRAAAVFWTALGLAVLTKSPAGPVLIATSSLVSWWWGGPTNCWKRLRWRWGPLICLAIVLPWNLAIMLRSKGEYYDVAVGYHIVRRMTTGIEEHGGFPGYYLVLSALTCFPWSSLLPAALYGAWSRRRESPVFGFLLGWVVGPLFLLEFVRTKLIHYYLPSFPAWALLIGWLVAAVSRSEIGLGQWPLGRLALRLLSRMGTLAILGIVALAWFAPPELVAPLLGLAGVMSAGAVLCAIVYRRGGIERCVQTLVVANAAGLILIGGWLLPRAEPFRTSAAVGRALATIEAREQATPVLASYQLPGIVYGLGHPAPTTRSRDEFLAHVERENKIVVPLNRLELNRLLCEPRLTVEVCDVIEGLNIEKVRHERIHLTLVRPREPAVTAVPPATILE